MGKYIIKRLLYIIPILFGVTLITFTLFNIVGSDPALQLAGKNADAELIASIRQELGLDRSLPAQYLFYLKQVVTFDWGYSWDKKTQINQLIWDGLGPSLSITVPAFALAVLFSLIVALVTSYYRDTWVDKVITVSCLALMSISFLVYIIALQKWLAFDVSLFPVYGWSTSWVLRWQYVSLPWLIYLFVATGPKALLFRSAILDEVQQDYVRTARSKGVDNMTLYLKHILKNAMTPILTMIVVQMPFLITGSLLLEAFFGIPGVGGLLVEAIYTSDFPVIKAMTVVGSLAYMFFNLLNDILYQWLDPRIELK